MTLADVKLVSFCAFYLACNFTVLFLPILVLGAFLGPGLVCYVCRAVLAVAAADYLVPLRPGPRGMWLWWCRVTNFAEGLCSYFAADIIMEGELRREKNYLLCYYPHGLFGISYSLMTRHIFDACGTICLFTGADVIMLLPLLRRIMVWWGFTPASAASMKRNLQLPWPHNVLELHPDGIAGMFFGTQHEQIVLSKRKGFCKLALQTGAALVPAYTFGANEVSSCVRVAHSPSVQVYTRYLEHDGVMARLSSAVRTSLVVWTGRWGLPFGFVPHPVKLVVVLGVPIEVERVEEPSREQVEALHARFVAAIRDVFERHKGRKGEEWVARRGALYLEDEPTPKGPKAD